MFDGVAPRVPIADLRSIAEGVDHAEGICPTPGDVLHPAAATLGYWR